MKEDIFVRRIYRYRGIAVIVEIDFLKRTISLVEATDEQGRFKNKKWLFAERGLEYMKGWRLILAAMDNAIMEASKELEELKEKDHKKILKMLLELKTPVDGKS